MNDQELRAIYGIVYAHECTFKAFATDIRALLADGGKGEAVAWRVHPFDYGVGSEGVYALTMRPDQVEAWKRKGWSVDSLCLCAAPQAECAPIAGDKAAAGTLIAIGRLLTEAGYQPELRIIEAVQDVIAKATQAECAPRDYVERDLVARARRIMEAVDAYNSRPDGDNRHALRSVLMDELEALKAERAPREAQPVAFVEGDEVQRVLRWNKDVAAFNYGIGTALYAAPTPERAPREAQPVGPRTTLNYDGTFDTTCAHCGGNGCFACLKSAAPTPERADAGKESGK
jgi:hypothetical protein